MRESLYGRCPVCDGPMPAYDFGRPPVYCGDECRNEITRRRRRISALESEVERAGQYAAQGFWPGKAFWKREATRLRRALRKARELVPS